MNGLNTLSTTGFSQVPAQSGLAQSQQLLAQGRIPLLEWENEWQGWEKLSLDVEQFKQVAEDRYSSKDEVDLRMGHIFLTLVQICSWYGVNAEESLSSAFCAVAPTARK